MASNLLCHTVAFDIMPDHKENGRSMMKLMSKIGLFALSAISGFALLPGMVSADVETSLLETFKQGEVTGQLKSYYFSQTFDAEGLDDSQIWVNGGNLGYKTDSFYGFKLGGTFQASFVGAKDDPQERTRGTLDADGAVLSEAYIRYNVSNTELKAGRQYLKSPMVAGSGSRMIKESFEAYLLSNKDIPDTPVTAGYVTRYQTRTDRSRYADNWFVDYEQNGTGDPGDFYKIGDDGMFFIYLKNNSVKNLGIQAQYLNVLDEVAGFYADAKYTFDIQFKPYLAAQIYYTDYDDDTKDNNDLYGFKGGVKVSDFDIFAGYTSAGGDVGDARVFRGVGQGSYSQYTATTKTAGAAAFEAGTDSFQIGTGYTYKDLAAKLRYTIFNNPAENRGLDEYTLNFLYKLPGWAEGFSVSIDFSILDYENDERDATDLRSRLIYTF